MIKKFLNLKAGFTLIEMIVALGLFTLVAFVSIGAILSVFSANQKAQYSKTIVDNLNFALENMARTVRFGTNYHCGGGNLSSPNDCPSGDTSFAVTFKGSVIAYRLNGTAIQRSDGGGGSYKNITSSDTVIQYARFYVLGSSNLDASQPFVIVVIKGYVGNRPTTQSVFSIQTLMSQRILDL